MTARDTLAASPHRPLEPRARLYQAKDGKHVFAINPGGRFDGWLLQWADKPGSALVAVRQLDRVPLPPDFDLERALREVKPVGAAR